MMLIMLIFGVVFTSVIQFIIFNEHTKKATGYRHSISFHIFYTLILIYCIVIIGFGLIYFLLSFYELTIVDGIKHSKDNLMNHLFTCIYFSGVTILTIGYGDVTPIGIGRFVAIIQALIGFILPTSFVLKLVYLNFEQKRNH